eukprot:m.545227 g.545227  ORF g.545227 m.545227 type:complete len:82 (-) comp22143_c0_seq5:1529-1774(-)
MIVFLGELGCALCCTADHLRRENTRCTVRWFGKAPVLVWGLLPMHIIVMVGFITWDVIHIDATGTVVYCGGNYDKRFANRI